jgi:hypothetical protein
VRERGGGERERARESARERERACARERERVVCTYVSVCVTYIAQSGVVGGMAGVDMHVCVCVCLCVSVSV